MDLRVTRGLLLPASVSLPEPAAPTKELWRDGSLRGNDRSPEHGLGVELPLLFFTRLRLDSFPLASERLGEPGRLCERDPEVTFRCGSRCFSLRPDGVLAPFDDDPEGGFVPSLGLAFGSCFAFCSSSRLRSSSFARSASESSLSLYILLDIINESQY